MIPDISKIKHETNPMSYEVAEFPKFNKVAYRKLEKPMRNRVKAIINIINTKLKGRIGSWWLL